MVKIAKTIKVQSNKMSVVSCKSGKEWLEEIRNGGRGGGRK